MRYCIYKAFKAVGILQVKVWHVDVRFKQVVPVNGKTAQSRPGWSWCGGFKT